MHTSLRLIMTVLRLAVLSGILGASASCLAKFALAPESPVVLWTRDACFVHQRDTDSKICDIVAWAPRGLCLLLMILLNILMVGTFLEGMEESGSVAGTGLATAANFCASALFGILLWNETVNQMWLFGFCLVVTGAGILSTVKMDEQRDVDRSKQE